MHAMWAGAVAAAGPAATATASAAAVLVHVFSRLAPPVHCSSRKGSKNPSFIIVFACLFLFLYGWRVLFVSSLDSGGHMHMKARPDVGVYKGGC